MRAGRLVIVSGMSGSGKSVALAAFEDMGYFCVDNLPAPLIPGFVDFLLDVPLEWSEKVAPSETAHGGELLPGHFAMQADCREPSSLPLVSQALERLKENSVEALLLFFDCSDEVLLQRFRETRRPHPRLLSEPELSTIEKAFTAERDLLASLRIKADRVIDTSAYSPHDLRRAIEGLFQHEQKLELSISSFGFKYGMPLDADLVVDVRFLANPHFVPKLKPLSGKDSEVSEFVLTCAETQEFVSRYLELLKFLLPKYLREGKRYLNIAIGCTGGRHRSVALAEHFADLLTAEGYQPAIKHRDISRCS